MIAQPPIWFIALAFLCAIGPLVFFHELGHYLVARWFGIGAEKFSIGFGKEIAGWTDKRGTRWKIGWLPLGGYVQFVGDMNAASQADANADLSETKRAVAFHNKPVWQRFLVVLAGPMANFLLAILLIAILFLAIGRPITPPVIQAVIPSSAAAKAGIQSGDRITAIAGRPIEQFEDIIPVVIIRPGEDVDIIVDRGGAVQKLTAHLDNRELVDRFGQKSNVGSLGVIGAPIKYTPVSVIEVLPEAADHTVGLLKFMIDGIWKIVAGNVSVKELGGPLKMAQVAGQQASLGLFNFIQLLALFSINLGFINLLPIPMLDGGHLVFYAAEAVRRRPVSIRVQDWAFRGGLALLLALIVFVTLNDLASFGLFERLGRLIG